MNENYMNIEDGYVVNFNEMCEILRDEYDLEDPTNALSWREYFIPLAEG